MLLLSYNCLIKLNFCPMHFFRFQRTWFYAADQGRPRSGYQTMSTIKGLLRHSKRKGKKKGFRWREKERVQRFKLEFNSPTRKRKMNKIRESRWRNQSHILEIIQDITLVSKERYDKTCTYQISFFPTKSHSPNYLGRQCPNKATWT